MTLNTLVAQLREKAAKARASRSDYCPMTFHVAPSNLEYLEIATPGNLTTILDAFDEMRDVREALLESTAMLASRRTLMRLDAEIGDEEHEG